MKDSLLMENTMELELLFIWMDPVLKGIGKKEERMGCLSKLTRMVKVVKLNGISVSYTHLTLPTIYSV